MYFRLCNDSEGLKDLRAAVALQPNDYEVSYICYCHVFPTAICNFSCVILYNLHTIYVKVTSIYCGIPFARCLRYCLRC